MMSPVLQHPSQLYCCLCDNKPPLAATVLQAVLCSLRITKPATTPAALPALILCCHMQAEPRAQLSLASRSASQKLKISPQDLILYSAKVRRDVNGLPVDVTGSAYTV
jgi:hypothetical protein